MKLELRAGMCLVLALAAMPGRGEDDRATVRLVSQTCVLCHGQDGNSTSPQFPRIAGQPAAYLESQLRAFRDQRRADPPAQAYMWGMSSHLDDAIIGRLATYFSSRTVRRTELPASTENTTGRTIYQSGLPEQGVPACVSCHENPAQEALAAPRLAGQHSEYLLRQLVYFGKGQRSTDATMVQLCARLTPEQMRQVASFAASH